MYMDRTLGGQGVSNEADVARAELPFEFMLNALRLREGFALSLFTERCGLPLSAIEKAPGRGREARPGRAHAACPAPNGCSRPCAGSTS